LGGCTQPRFTENAPPEFYNLKNPLTQPTEADYAAARVNFIGDGKKASCASCHGEAGDGKGPMSDQFSPPPRDFACKAIKEVSDGHLFWIIRYGSPGTSMPAHKRLKDAQVWQLVWYLRRLTQ
jgi:mono/diheme cytochrome c family protein